MKFRVLKKIVKLVYRLSTFNGKPFRFLYETEYKKHPVSADMPESTHIDRVEPKDVGVDNEYIQSYFNEIACAKGVVTHSIAISKDGKYIANYDTYPYDSNIWHTSFSMSKSVVGLVVGIAMDEGYFKLDDKIGDVIDFTKYDVKPDDEVKNCTIKDLLTMTARVNYGEDGALVDSDWLKGFMEAGKKDGVGFNYNSMCTFMLAFIVGHKTGVGFSEYADKKLFQPLGIRRAFFEKNAVGHEKGGFGLLITVEDMLKLGNLVLNRGMYEGVRVVSEQYITDMTSVQSHPPKYVSRYAYGYQTWVGEDVYMFNGMFGQNVFIFPATRIVVAVTGGDDDMFHDNPIFNITIKYFKHLDHAPTTFIKESQVRSLSLDGLEGKSYKFGKKACRIGIMPIVAGVFQGTYPSGVKSLSFSDSSMIVEEYKGSYTIPLTTDSARQILDIGGDRYEISTVSYSEEDSIIIDLYFLELASKRQIKLTPCGDKLKVWWDETPGVVFLKGGDKIVLGAVKGKRFLTWFLSRPHRWLWRRIDRTLSPKLVGKRVK